MKCQDDRNYEGEFRDICGVNFGYVKITYFGWNLGEDVIIVVEELATVNQL